MSVGNILILGVKLTCVFVLKGGSLLYKIKFTKLELVFSFSMQIIKIFFNAGYEYSRVKTKRLFCLILKYMSTATLIIFWQSHFGVLCQERYARGLYILLSNSLYCVHSVGFS